jgi:hypothetical protein
LLCHYHRPSLVSSATHFSTADYTLSECAAAATTTYAFLFSVVRPSDAGGGAEGSDPFLVLRSRRTAFHFHNLSASRNNASI